MDKTALMAGQDGVSVALSVGNEAKTGVFTVGGEHRRWRPPCDNGRSSVGDRGVWMPGGLVLEPGKLDGALSHKTEV